MTYEQFKEQADKAIAAFPSGRIFYLREIFGTEAWNEIPSQKMNFGRQFYRDYQAGQFPNIEEYDKCDPQKEQRYKKK